MTSLVLLITQKEHALKGEIGLLYSFDESTGRSLVRLPDRTLQTFWGRNVYSSYPKGSSSLFEDALKLGKYKDLEKLQEAYTKLIN